MYARECCKTIVERAKKSKTVGCYRSKNRSVIAGCAVQGSAIGVPSTRERKGESDRESGQCVLLEAQAQATIAGSQRLAGRPLGLWRTAAPTAPTIAPAASRCTTLHRSASPPSNSDRALLTSCLPVTTAPLCNALQHRGSYFRGTVYEFSNHAGNDSSKQLEHLLSRTGIEQRFSCFWCSWWCAEWVFYKSFFTLGYSQGIENVRALCLVLFRDSRFYPPG